MSHLQNLLLDALLGTKHVDGAAFIKLQERSLCVASPGFSENTGVVVVKTRLYLLVATYTAGMYPSVCVEATEKLGDYLRKKGS
ncbi:Profilin-4 [Heterocephalus glaber]|uniref:Profilin-4 n=1 Tax=Heterocephalus glaber TaxID=10181 RepID=G5C385_HETGA|nr:Profilin-4 [Heterocephalus glaber]